MNIKPTKHRTANSGKPRVILLLDTDRDYRRGLLRGISNFFKLHGQWDVHLSRPLTLSGILKLIESWNPDGLILETLPSKDIEKFVLLQIPSVILGIPAVKSNNIGLLVPNNIQMGKMAAEYYLRKGFKSYAFCGYDFSSLGPLYKTSWPDERFVGFSNVLAEKGFTIAVHKNTVAYLTQRRDEKKLYKEKDLARMGNWLKKLPRPVAIFACNDIRAGDVIAASQLVGLKIPDEVAVLGVDNDEFVCDFFNPPISSIAYNIERAGYEAAELLEKIISGQHVDSNEVYIKPTHIVERQSTNVLQIDDPDVRNALRYIYNHSNHILQIRDILQHVAVSKRTLELKFAKTLGHTVHDEIHRFHVQHIQKLLTETNMPIFDIARSLGYTAEQNISRLFREAMGCTPREYRRKFGRK